MTGLEALEAVIEILDDIGDTGIMAEALKKFPSPATITHEDMAVILLETATNYDLHPDSFYWNQIADNEMRTRLYGAIKWLIKVREEPFLRILGEVCRAPKSIGGED